MKKTILIILLIAVIIFGALSRLSISGWLFLVGLISIGVFGLIHLIIHFRLIKISKHLKPLDYGIIAISHILYLGLFLFQNDFGDDRGAVVIEEVFGTIPINNLEQNSGTYLAVFFIAYLVWTTLILFRIKYLDKTFSNKKIIAFCVTVFLIITLPILTIYIINKTNKSSRIDRAEKKGEYENLDRALRHIKNVKRLELHEHQTPYTEIPDGVFNLTELEELDMFSNKITSIPARISNLSKLKVLKLNYNLIEEIPDEVFQLDNLEELDLMDNNLKFVSHKICDCKNLKKIRLSGHSLDSIPFCINDLPNLELLVIESDSINKLFDDLKYFKNLKRLDVFSYGVTKFDHKKYDEMKKELKGTKHNW